LLDNFLRVNQKLKHQQASFLVNFFVCVVGGGGAIVGLFCVVLFYVDFYFIQNNLASFLVNFFVCVVGGGGNRGIILCCFILCGFLFYPVII
jgi:hypothetical protein